MDSGLRNYVPRLFDRILVGQVLVVVYLVGQQAVRLITFVAVVTCLQVPLHDLLAGRQVDVQFAGRSRDVDTFLHNRPYKLGAQVVRDVSVRSSLLAFLVVIRALPGSDRRLSLCGLVKRGVHYF